MADQEQLIPFQEEENSTSFKDILATAKEYWQEIRRNWRLVAYIAGGLAALLLYFAVTTKATYTANLTFMVDDGSDGGSTATSVLAAFGFAKPATQNLDKIVALAKSRRIISNALFAKATIDGKEDFFANHFIREYDLHDKWKDNDALKDFLFTAGDDTKFERKENAALLTLYYMLVGRAEPGLMIPSYVNASGIMTLSITTTNEALSIGFLEVLFDRLSSYYILKNIEKEQATYDLVKTEVDSLKRVIVSKTYGAARFTDQSAGILFNYNRVPGAQLQKEGEIAVEVYGKALANLELADYALKDNRPYVMAIDTPISPVPAFKPSAVLQFVIGLVGGAFLGAMFVAGRKKYREFIATALA